MHFSCFQNAFKYNFKSIIFVNIKHFPLITVLASAEKCYKHFQSTFFTFPYIQIKLWIFSLFIVCIKRQFFEYIQKKRDNLSNI